MTVQQGHREHWQEEEDRNSSNDGAQEISITFWAEKKIKFKDRKKKSCAALKIEKGEG